MTSVQYGHVQLKDAISSNPSFNVETGILIDFVNTLIACRILTRSTLTVA